jgi:hypothetical protein
MPGVTKDNAVEIASKLGIDEAMVWRFVSEMQEKRLDQYRANEMERLDELLGPGRK